MTTPPERHPIGDGWTLLDRDAHRAAMNRLLTGVAAGSGSALVFAGAPGIGKSALLDAAARQTEAIGISMLRATGVRGEVDLPFAGLHQILCPLMPALDRLPVPQRDLLQSAFGVTSGGADRFRVALAVLDLLSEVAATRPLLLGIDDAHWLDEPSAEVFAFIGRRLGAEPIGLLAAVRDEAVVALAGLPRMLVETLSDGSAQRLLMGAFPDLPARMRVRLLTMAQGNPLALLELPKTVSPAVDSASLPGLVAPVSVALEHSYTARARGLPAVTRTLLLAAAADGSTSAADVLAAGSAVLNTDVTVGALQPAIDARLLDVVGGHVVFTHPLIDSAIYQSATVQERHAVHLAVAAAVGSETDRGLWHRAAAALGPDPTLADQLDTLAGRAAAKGAPAVALAALDRSANLTDDQTLAAQRWLRAAEAACELGRSEQALTLLARADHCQLGLDGRVRAMVVEELAESASLGDRARLAAILQLVGELRGARADEAAIGLLWNAATKCWRADTTLTDRRAILSAAAELDLPDGDFLAPVLRACLAPGEVDSRALAGLCALGDSRTDLSILAWRGCGAVFVGAYPQALQDLSDAIVLARAKGQLALVARLGLAAALAATWSGQLARAAATAQEAKRSAEDIGFGSWVSTTNAAALVVQALRGAYPDAQAIEHAERELAQYREHYVLAHLQHGLGLAALGVGDHPQARRCLERILDPRDPARHYGVRLCIAGDLAEAVAATEGRAAARTATAPLLEEISDVESSALAVGARYAIAVSAPPKSAQDAFETALAADLDEWPLARARLQLAYGIWLRETRRPVEARSPLRSARDTFDLLGAAPWAHRTRGELAATGEFSGPHRAPRWSTLTAQEWQIASMAAAGLTNRQIGQQLFLSHRTVGSHLYHLFPKLGVTARGQLADALAELTDPQA